MLNLDTHILVHALSGNLYPRERVLVDANPWGISAIVLWEIAKLRQLGRLSIDIESAKFKSALRWIQLWPITTDIVVTSTQLDFNADPADEFIAATSLVHGVPLLTRDGIISASRVVPLA